MPSTPESSSARTWRGPNERNSKSVSGAVNGDAAAVTSRVFPTRLEAITPACSARTTSRCTDDTDDRTREASSVSVHSLVGSEQDEGQYFCLQP